MTPRAAFIAIAIFAVFALVLLLLGRSFICECGYIKLWHGGGANDLETSQHLTDWYTPSHIIHGFAFYFLTWFLARRWPRLAGLQPLGARLILALLLEAGWEIVENTNWIINYYRQNTVSVDYNGDTIINALADLLAMMAGFALARRLPVWSIIALIALLEIASAIAISDNLTLNILMFIYPFQSVLRWQQGLG